jgi:hypothetical protein
VGATIYLNGTNKGYSDSNGRLVISGLYAGTYTLKITKTGYQDTDDDDLENDSITVTI